MAIDTEFHRLFIKCTGNQNLLDTNLPILSQLIITNETVDLNESHSYTLSTMHQLLVAIKNRDPQSTQMAIWAHIQPLKEFIERSFTN